MTKTTTRTITILAAAAALFALAGTAGARVFRDATSVVVVEVPVHVLRDGQPVRGLTKEDFVVLDERKPQEIVDFEVIDLTASPAALSPTGAPAAPVRPPSSARRHFLFLFDLTFSQPESVIKARDAASQLLREGLHPTDLVAVATYSHAGGPRLLLGFTSDRPQAAAAIDSLGLTQLIEPLRDPLGLVFGDLEGAARAFGLGRTFGVADKPGNQARLELAKTIQEYARRAERGVQRQSLQRISALSRSFADLARLMDSAGGRKHVVYLSEGFDTSALFGTEDTERKQQTARAVEEGRVWEVDSEEVYGDTHSQNQLEHMFEAFRRADCTIQSVDISGLQRTTGVETGSRRARERSRARLSGQQDSLAVMAASTGGELIRNTNDLGVAIGEVIDRTALTYVLAIQPRDLELDGGYHRLKVKLKDGGRGLRLVHRPGYYAPRPFAELGEMERKLSTADLILGGTDGGALGAAVLASPVPSSGGLAYVPTFLEISGRDLVAAAPRDSLSLGIYAYALDRDGRVRDFLGHTLAVDVEKARAVLETSGVKFYGHFDLPPGGYTLRFLVRDLESGLYGLRSLELEVPDFAAGEPVLLPPFFVEAPGRWLMVRENLEKGETPPAFPFMISGQPFLPAARPELSPDGAVPVNLIAYHLEAGLEVTSRVRSALGAELSEPRILLARDPALESPGRVTAAASLAAGALAAGEYTLEVTVTERETGRSASSSAPFVVQ
ncbi:MAG: VWA domain-containing protein [bacterium]|nr:VWA domain-containing protein [bacterium]